MRKLLLVCIPTIALSIGVATPASAAGTPNPSADCNGRFVTASVTQGPGFGQFVAGLAQTEHPLGATDVSLTATGAVDCPV